ncbi:CocE/NonD family hydrolase [Actinoalloteichus fjordicus]|uniref:Hydrolase, CocE/NonD family n=1 Tax=Actinoalloteichus fjordicus TaxID=1612552 RepID=A0AAC9PUE0_9PSEU|nr:CocE/NonD family hydrolase [Actinoalloteichus fjordicus]APU16866.1 putative hydrolase, CocE/NonD family [Actinoalloteichus fjordicus]
MNRSRHPVAVSAAAAVVLAATGAMAGSAVAEPATGAVATADKSVTHEENDRVPEGAAWTQHYFPSSDGSEVELHADVLLPADLAEGEQVPVILSAGAYFGHSGQTDVEDWTHTGPSDRFNDFIEGTDLFDRGYAFVMVDTRGFGGSTGCLDFAGPGDEADVKAAIDWAADQSWSTGAVGMYGKSWDAITGLMGNNLDQDALKAVVAQEPIWDLQRNIRSNGVPRTTIVNTANAYNKIAELPQMPDDDPRYLANAAYEDDNPMCIVENLLGYQNADPESEYWRARDFAEHAKGTDTPLFVTQGFLEWNTEPEAMQEFLENHEGPQRGWLGQWDHVRGNDRVEDGRLAMGREGWFEETISFYDQYLKDVEPSVEYPNFAVQDSNGTWRAQDSWPVTDSAATLPIGGGSYLDDGAEAGPTDENTFVQWSEPLEQDTRITGTPRISLAAGGYGDLMVKLYDVAPDGNAVMFDEQVSRVKPGAMGFDLKSTDWTMAAGHSLAVEIGTIQPGGDWLKTPAHETIQVDDVELELALDDPADDNGVPGERAPYLDTYLAAWSKELPIGTPSFTVPPARG